MLWLLLLGDDDVFIFVVEEIVGLVVCFEDFDWVCEVLLLLIVMVMGDV